MTLEIQDAQSIVIFAGRYSVERMFSDDFSQSESGDSAVRDILSVEFSQYYEDYKRIFSDCSEQKISDSERCAVSKQSKLTMKENYKQFSSDFDKLVLPNFLASQISFDQLVSKLQVVAKKHSLIIAIPVEHAAAHSRIRNNTIEDGMLYITV